MLTSLDALKSVLVLAATLVGLGCASESTGGKQGAASPGTKGATGVAAAAVGQLELTVLAPVEAVTCDHMPIRFIVVNKGPGAVPQVRVHWDLPENLHTDSGMQAWDADLGDLQPGATAEARASVQTKEAGVYPCQASVSGSDGSRADSNSTSMHVGKPMLKLVLAGPEHMVAGQDIAYTLDVTNAGDGLARDVILEDQLPYGLKVASATDGARVAETTVQFYFGNMQAGATRRVEVSLRGAAVGTLRNTATVQAVCSKVAGATAETVISAEAGHSPR